MKKKENKTEFSIGCGNVFKDLGFRDPEEALAKSNLARQIHKTIKSRNLTQEQTAEILGIDQPKVSDIIRGNLSKFSLDRLMRFVRMLGNDVEIRVKRGSKKKSRPSLHVFEEAVAKDSQASKLMIRRKPRSKV